MQVQDVCEWLGLSRMAPEGLWKYVGPGVGRSYIPDLEGRISFQIAGFGVSEGRDGGEVQLGGGDGWDVRTDKGFGG